MRLSIQHGTTLKGRLTLARIKHGNNKVRIQTQIALLANSQHNQGISTISSASKLKTTEPTLEP